MTDDQGVVHTRLLVQGASVPLDSTGLATYLAAAPGIYSVLAQATDASGNTGTAETTLVVEADTVPPVAQVGPMARSFPRTVCSQTIRIMWPSRCLMGAPKPSI